jgi:hypothetical protein
MVEEDRVVCIRFGHDHNEDCMAMDETLYGVSEKVQNFAVIYLGELECARAMTSEGAAALHRSGVEREVRAALMCS